jgi:hypothetical protein
MTKIMLKNWFFKRAMGLKDIKTIIDVAKKKSEYKKAVKLKEAKGEKLESPKHLAEIIIGHDRQIDSWVEPMAAGTESCPYWDSTRLFYGKEANFDWGEKPFEYFLGIRQTFLAPIIPIPICSYEAFYILGESDKPFRDCLAKYHKARAFYDHAEEFGATKIYDQKNVYLVECDVAYKNDPIYSTCG